MYSKHLNRIAIGFIGVVSILLIQCNPEQKKIKPRILISTDIGGTDPDDFQSMIHLLIFQMPMHFVRFVSNLESTKLKRP